LQHFLDADSDRYPDKEAIIAEGRKLSYSEFNDQTIRLANALRANGVQRGDRVVVFLDNSVEAVVSIYGAVRCGAAFSMVNTQTKRAKFEFILDDCRPAAVILQRRYAQHIAACRSCSHVRLIVVVDAQQSVSTASGNTVEAGWQELLADHAADRFDDNCIDLDLASIIYTSGTTGNPKGVMHTHRSMVSASTSITTYLENIPEDRIINMLPLSFDYGLYQALMSVQMGATLILERSFSYPYAICETVKRERVTGFPGVPTVFAMLLAMDPQPREHLASVRYVSNTGAALPVPHIMAMQELFSNARIYSMYGVTECKRVSYMPPEELNARPKSVGKGMPNEEIWIVKENGERALPGQVGELVVRGTNVMLGYWERPEESAAVLKPGIYPGERVLMTGDLFRMDKDGYLYFVSRKDDIIKSRGEKVSPREVENAIYGMPEVFEVLVAGVDDEVLGQAIMAYIVLQDGRQVDAQTVRKHCMKHLENFMVPKFVEFVDELPKTTSGKISRSAVEKRATSRVGDIE
jgi:amino acid adenylation domain-containing protein